MKFFLVIFIFFSFHFKAISQTKDYEGFLGSLNFGVSIPAFEIKNYVRSYNLGVNIGYKWNNFGVLTDYGYQNFKYSSNKLNLHILSFSSQLFYGKFKSKINPYVKIGFGLYISLRQVVLGRSWYSSTYVSGINGALGIQFKLNNNIGTLLEGGFHRTLNTDNEITYFPVRVGIMFQQTLY